MWDGKMGQDQQATSNSTLERWFFGKRLREAVWVANCVALQGSEGGHEMQAIRRAK